MYIENGKVKERSDVPTKHYSFSSQQTNKTQFALTHIFISHTPKPITEESFQEHL